jgi:hypothetical protein
MKSDKYMIKRAGMNEARDLSGQAIQMWPDHDLETIKERFTARMHGNLPAPVALMLERKHGMFDSGEYDYRFDGAKGDAKAFCEVLKRGKCG